MEEKIKTMFEQIKKENKKLQDDKTRESAGNARESTKGCLLKIREPY